MQKGHEEVLEREISLKPSNDIKIDKTIIAHTIEQFVCEEDKVSFEVYKALKQKLEASLNSQDLNYLTAAYYLTSKH